MLNRATGTHSLDPFHHFHPVQGIGQTHWLKPIGVAVFIGILAFGMLLKSVQAAVPDVPMGKIWQLDDAWGQPYAFPAPNKKVHVLVFWASWCPYCHKLMPEVEALYQQLPREKVEFLAINAWDSADPEAFMMEHDYQFPVLVHGETIAPLYGIKAVPEVLVFDQNMNIVYRRRTGQSAREVANAMAEKISALLQPKSGQTAASAETGASQSSATLTEDKSGEADQEAVAMDEVLSDFYAFAEPQGNAIAIQQIPVEDRSRYLWLDTRSAEKYRQGHIPGAVHMEWREVYDRRGELPHDREIILYCSGGVVAAQAMMGLKLAGFDNVHTLAGGYRRFVEYEQQRQQEKK